MSRTSTLDAPRIEFVDGGHNSRVEGVNEVIARLMRWVGLIEKIRTGSLERRGSSRGGARKRQSAVRISSQDPDGNVRTPFVCVDQSVRWKPKSRKGGTRVTALGYAKSGKFDDIRTGIWLEVVHGTRSQRLLLAPLNGAYEPLIKRLIEEGMCTREAVERW